MTPLLAAVLVQTPSTSFVETVGFLLAHGLGDPRGGEFRQATLHDGTVVRGWVVGSRVVTTRGLVYDAAKVGPPSDVAQDVQAQKEAHGLPDGRWYSNGAWDILYAAELSAAGRPDLAAGLARGSSGLEALGGLLAAQLDQTVRAFETGDDALALRAARAVVSERGAFEAELRRRAAKPDAAPSFGFVETAARIEGDAARRLARPRPPLDPAALRGRPVADRVAILIERLDDVTAAGVRVDGVADPSGDPLVREIVALGAPAVGPLIDAVERDPRLTRAVSRWNMTSLYSPVPVRQAAYAAFCGIVQVDVSLTTDGPFDVAAMRRFWAANGAKTPAERWLAVLADDTAGAARWAEAAVRLFDGASVRHGVGNVSLTYPRTRGVPAAESLRRRTNPSLGVLLARRAREMGSRGAARPDGFLLAAGLGFARRLAVWDPPAALPVLRELSRRAMGVASGGGAHTLAQTAVPLVRVLEARSRLGDSQVWAEYAAWVARLPGPGMAGRDLAFLAPLARRPGDPVLRALAKRLFAPGAAGVAASAMRDLRRGEGGPSPLLAVPEFRAATLRALDDRTVVGEVRVDADGIVKLRQNGWGWDQGGTTVLEDPLRPHFGERLPLRVGDVLAASFRGLRGAPTFRSYWPERERDAAIARLKAFLRSNGGGIDALLGWPENWRDWDERR